MRRDGVVLAALLVVQFLISPEVLVMCLMLAVVGLVAVVVVGWRQVVPRAGHALPALGLGAGIALVLLAYPAWFGLAGPQAVTGVLFVIAPLTGVSFSGVLSPGQFRAAANAYVRIGGYLGHLGPPTGLSRPRGGGRPGGRRAGPAARPDLAAGLPDRGDTGPVLRALSHRRPRLARRTCGCPGGRWATCPC